MRRGFLQESLLASVPMSPGAPASTDEPVLGSALTEAIDQRYDESGAEGYGIPPGEFRHIVAAVVVRYAADASEAEQMQLVVSLHVAELALARACSAGNDAAWETFLARFRSSMYAAANRITRNDATGRELADGLYAELYGLPDRNGRRVSKLDYYMGRGSLEGWLRTVLSQQYVDRYRSQKQGKSPLEQIEVVASASGGHAGYDPLRPICARG